MGDFSSGTRARKTIRSTTSARRSRPRCSTPSAAARSCTRPTSRASIRRTSAPAARRRRRRLAARLSDPRACYDVNARMMGVSGLAGDPAYPPKDVPLRRWRSASSARPGPRVQFARLALVAVGQRHHHARVGRAGAVSTRSTCLSGCAGRKGSTDITYWPRAAPGRHPPAALPRARDHRRRQRHGRRRHLLRRRGRRAPAEGARGGRRLQRHRHAAPAAELEVQTVPRWARQPQRSRRQEPDVPSVRHGDRHLRRAA